MAGRGEMMMAWNLMWREAEEEWTEAKGWMDIWSNIPHLRKSPSLSTRLTLMRENSLPPKARVVGKTFHRLLCFSLLLALPPWLENQSRDDQAKVSVLLQSLLFCLVRLLLRFIGWVSGVTPEFSWLANNMKSLKPLGRERGSWRAYQTLMVLSSSVEIMQIRRGGLCYLLPWVGDSSW